MSNNDLADKVLAQVTADGVKTWHQLIEELFTDVPYDEMLFSDCYITCSNWVLNHMGAGEFVQFSCGNTGFSNMVINVIARYQYKYLNANGTFTMTDLSSQVATSGQKITIYQRGGSYH